jgi:cytochrome P450
MHETLEPGNRVLLSWSAANRDPRKFERADELQFDRANAGRRLTLSFGIDRCLGSMLTQMKIRVTLQTTLERRDDNGRYASIGGIDGFESMPAVFTPDHDPFAAAE